MAFAVKRGHDLTSIWCVATPLALVSYQREVTSLEIRAMLSSTSKQGFKPTTEDMVAEKCI